MDLAGVLKDLERETGVGVRDIHSRDSRTRRIVLARWTAWKRLHEAGASLHQIARAWGCDHSSILHAKRKGWEPAQMGSRTAGEPR